MTKSTSPDGRAARKARRKELKKKQETGYAILGRVFARAMTTAPDDIKISAMPLEEWICSHGLQPGEAEYIRHFTDFAFEGDEIPF